MSFLFRTLRQDYRAFIYLKVDESSCNSKVSKMIDVHSHPISKNLFDQLPNQKRLPPEKEQDICDYLHVKANKKMVQEKILETSFKHLTSRDLSNIAARGN